MRKTIILIVLRWKLGAHRNACYTQTDLNLARFTFATDTMYSWMCIAPILRFRTQNGNTAANRAGAAPRAEIYSIFSPNDEQRSQLSVVHTTHVRNTYEYICVCVRYDEAIRPTTTIIIITGTKAHEQTERPRETTTFARIDFSSPRTVHTVWQPYPPLPPPPYRWTKTKARKTSPTYLAKPANGSIVIYYTRGNNQQRSCTTAVQTTIRTPTDDHFRLRGRRTQKFSTRNVRRRFAWPRLTSPHRIGNNRRRTVSNFSMCIIIIIHYAKAVQRNIDSCRRCGQNMLPGVD